MLSKLRGENKILREKLNQLRKESSEFYNYNFDATDNFVRRSQSSRKGEVMLSDRAKAVRGEASKRIESLLQDWREYKDRTDEENRRRYRAEQHLKDTLARKHRELEEMSYELSSFRTLALDLKKTVDQLLEERETEAKYRQRCADVELKFGKLSRRYNEVMSEMQVREEVIDASNTEREALLSVNAELRRINQEQKRKLDICEKDVTDTRVELEMVEEMVRTLNDKKAIFSQTLSDDIEATRLETTIGRTRNYSGQRKTGTPKFDERPKMHSTANYSEELKSGLSLSTIGSDNGSPQPSDSQERSMESKKSAMTALKSLQKEHYKECSELVEHIQKLKDENRLKKSNKT